MTREINRERMRSRLRDLRKAKGWTQEALGDQLGRSKVTIAEWEGTRSDTLPSFEMLEQLSKLFNVELEYLLGLEANETTGGVVWRTAIPEYRDQAVSSKVEAVVEAFRDMLADGKSFDQLNMQYGRMNSDQLAQMLSIALRTGIIRIQTVQTDPVLADKTFQALVKSKSTVFDVTVVKTQGIVIPHIVASMVALKAAEQFTPRIIELMRDFPTVKVGVANGYTVTRIGEMVYSPLMSFPNLEFVPLLASHSVRREASSSLYNAAIFSRRFYESGSLVIDSAIPETEKRFPHPHDMSMIISTVRRRPAADDTDTAGDQRIDASMLLPQDDMLGDLDTLHKRPTELAGAHNQQTTIGEFAGWPITLQGKIDTQPNNELVRYPYEALRQICGRSESWLVAAGAYKQAGVLAAIRAGLVNKLVIDETIASYLIEQLTGKPVRERAKA